MYVGYALKCFEFFLQHELIAKVDDLIKQKTYVDGKIKVLSRMLPVLHVIKNEAEGLVHTIKNISDSSEKISGKIRTLDRARVNKLLIYFNRKIINNFYRVEWKIPNNVLVT